MPSLLESARKMVTRGSDLGTRIEAEYRIPVQHPDVQQVAAIQQELAALLFARADAT